MRTPLLFFVLGSWAALMGTAALAATLNFRAADGAAGASAPAELRELKDGQRRMLLRHAAAESNRALFSRLGWAQLGLGACVLVLAWPLGAGARAAALGLAGLALVQALALAPAIDALGRSLDFVPRPLPLDLARRFGLWHGAYGLAELAKGLLLLTTAFLAARR